MRQCANAPLPLPLPGSPARSSLTWRDDTHRDVLGQLASVKSVSELFMVSECGVQSNAEEADKEI